LIVDAEIPIKHTTHIIQVADVVQKVDSLVSGVDFQSRGRTGHIDCNKLGDRTWFSGHCSIGNSTLVRDNSRIRNAQDGKAPHTINFLGRSDAECVLCDKDTGSELSVGAVCHEATECCDRLIAGELGEDVSIVDSDIEGGVKVLTFAVDEDRSVVDSTHGKVHHALDGKGNGGGLTRGGRRREGRSIIVCVWIVFETARNKHFLWMRSRCRGRRLCR